MRSLLALLLLAGGAVPEPQGPAERPLVTLSLGRARGAWLTSAQGTRYAAFMSLPYAEPPLGHLRFRTPEPRNPWPGEWDAGSPSPQCLQYTQLFGNATESLTGTEDCLYLNVYTPKVDPAARMPVLVYIHGGAFMFSQAAEYGARLLMDREVVLVVLNYRLGPLGFLSLEDEVLPGNLGLWDQNLALRWIRDHVTQFGGDPELVTLIGCSAGGASVHFHYLAPPSRGLFRNGVSLSGTALCRWALADGAREKAVRLAGLVGCTPGPAEAAWSSPQLVQCLRSRPAELIVRQVQHFLGWPEQYAPYSPFAPVVERSSSSEQTPFLPDDPVKIITRGEALAAPWVTGVTTHEGLYPVASFIADEAAMSVFERDFEALLPHLLHYNFTVPPERRAEVAAAIRAEYFGSRTIDSAQVQQVIKMAGDRLFVVDARRAAELQSEHSAVFFYEFAHRGTASLSDLMARTDTDFGVSHADDVGYFMNVSYIVEKSPRSGVSLDVERIILDLWTSFAKHGVPSSQSCPAWPQVTPHSARLRLLRLSSSPEVREEQQFGNPLFWEALPFTEPQQSLQQQQPPPRREEL